MLKYRQLQGRLACRHTFSMLEQKSKRYILLFGVIDIIEPDMQDYPQSIEEALKAKPFLYRSSKSSGSNEYNVYYARNFIIVTNEMLENPFDNYFIGKDEMKSDMVVIETLPKNGDFSFIVNKSQGETELTNILPKRDCLYYVNTFIKDNGNLKKIFNEHSYLKDQLAEISVKNIHTDLMKSFDLIGSIFVIHYHPIIRRIDFRMGNDCVYASMTKRENSVDCTFDVHVLYKNDNAICVNESQTKWNTQDRLVKLPMQEKTSNIDVVMLDTDGDIVYHYLDMAFLKRITLFQNVLSKQLSITGGGNGKVKIPKYEEEETVIGDRKGDDFSSPMYKISEEELWRRSERNLEFIYLDGAKEENAKNENISKARRFVAKILGTAHKEIFICDPYFDMIAFDRYIYGIQRLNVNVFIIASKEMKKSEATLLQETIDRYLSSMQMSTVQCKVTKGAEPLFHDRYIIADDTIWLLGTSLNNIGERATTIVKVPLEYRKNLIKEIKDVWYSNDKVEELKDYGKN